MKKLILTWTEERLEKLTHKQLTHLIVKNECTKQS